MFMSLQIIINLRPCCIKTVSASSCPFLIGKDYSDWLLFHGFSYFLQRHCRRLSFAYRMKVFFCSNHWIDKIMSWHWKTNCRAALHEIRISLEQKLNLKYNNIMSQQVSKTSYIFSEKLYPALGLKCLLYYKFKKEWKCSLLRWLDTSQVLAWTTSLFYRKDLEKLLPQLH